MRRAANNDTIASKAKHAATIGIRIDDRRFELVVPRIDRAPPATARKAQQNAAEPLCQKSISICACAAITTAAATATARTIDPETSASRPTTTTPTKIPIVMATTRRSTPSTSSGDSTNHWIANNPRPPTTTAIRQLAVQTKPAVTGGSSSVVESVG